MTKGASIPERIAGHAALRPEAAAILAPGRPPLSYGGLLAQIREATAALRGAGLGPRSRIAAALPDGPEMAAAFLSFASAAVFVPLSPAWSRDEAADRLTAVKADAVVVPAGADAAARQAAGDLGIEVLELHRPAGGPAGRFTLSTPHIAPLADGWPAGHDLALVLLTSGTTARPKVVPLTHANVLASGRNICRAFRLTDRDRRLNLMPLAHVQGLIGGVLAPLVAGGGTICTAGFDPDAFFDWLEELQPTWYSAVPTMHEALLARCGRQRERLARAPLRFIRSGSFALSERSLTALERAFGVPVIECYGMTEAASQITCNPLTPGQRKPGSVGVPAGPRVRVADAAGRPLPPGRTGEIVIRGPNVTAGYEAPAAQQEAFFGRWLRTGDLGRFDGDGFLFLEGRLKEMINRGGEKVSPYEVEAALLSHPAVAQAVAFAVPDGRLGEEIGAAVVLRPGHTAEEGELRELAAGRVALFKVPRWIRIVEALPQSPAGKPQRVGLAHRLGLGLQPQPQPVAAHRSVAPRDATEARLMEIWQDLLQVRPAGVTDDFFDLGGHSGAAVVLMARIERAFGQSLPLTALLPDATIEALARHLRRRDEAADASPLVPIQPAGDGPPLFVVHPAGGSVLCYVPLARLLGPRQAVYGLQGPSPRSGPDPLPRLEDMAARYVEAVRAVRPRGPYRLAGHSLGGLISFEMARLLAGAGEEVDLVALIDSFCPTSGFRRSQDERIHRFAAILEASNLDDSVTAEEDGRLWAELCRLVGRAPASDGRRGPQAADADRAAFLNRVRELGFLPPDDEMAADELRRYLRFLRLNYQAARRYAPQRYPGRIVYFRAGDELPAGCTDPALGWSSLAGAGAEVHVLPGHHFNLFTQPALGALAERLRLCLAAPGS